MRTPGRSALVATPEVWGNAVTDVVTSVTAAAAARHDGRLGAGRVVRAVRRPALAGVQAFAGVQE